MKSLAAARTLASLAGSYVLEVALGEGDVALSFSVPRSSPAWDALTGSTLDIFGRWLLRDANGKVIDRTMPLGEREGLELWRVCMSSRQDNPLVRAELITEPRPLLILRTSDGWQLEVLSDDDGRPDWTFTIGYNGPKIACNGTLVEDGEASR